MSEWIVRNWQHQWLGNFAWWQAVAGLAQALFAVLLLRISRDLVHLGLFQSRLQKQSLKVALFQKRLDVFLALMGFLTKGSAELPDAFKLLRDTNTADLLFGPEIEKFIRDVYSHVVKIHSLERAVANPQQNSEGLEALANQLQPLEEWLYSKAFEEAKRLFRPYLDN